MPRGRPRQFDEEAALTAAMLVFWQKGLSATSLDDLAGAMQMNRPSIYNAFGNKDALYRRALASFCGRLEDNLTDTLGDGSSARDGITAFLYRAIDVYCAGETALGCLMICTAPTEAVVHEEVRQDLRGLISRLDHDLSQKLNQSVINGEIDAATDPLLTAKLLQATLHTLAVRARAGESRTALRRLARYAVERLLG